MLKVIGGAQEGEFKAVASGTLPSGQPVVVNADGTVSVVAASGGGPSVGSSAVFETASIATTGATFDSNSNKVVITYQDLGNSGYGTAVVGTVSGTSISFGTPTVFASASVSYFDEATTFDSNSNKVVIAYRNPSDNNRGYAIVGTVSGTDISFGTAVRFVTGITAYIGATFDSNSNKVVIVFRDDSNSNYGKAIVGTVSGTSISYGAAATYYAGTSSFNTATFDNNSNKVVIAYQRGSHGNCIVGTVSGTSISFGTTVQFDNSTGEMKPVFDSTNNKVVIAYNKSSAAKAVVGTVSGTAISFGTAVEFNATAASLAPVFDSDSNKVVIAYYNSGNSNYGEVIVGTVSGTDISFGSAVALHNASTTQIAATFDTNSNKVTIAYKDGGNSNYGTASVFSTDGTNLTSENYIGMSRGVVDVLSQTLGSAVVFEAGDTTILRSTFDSNSNRVVFSYRDGGNSSYGTAVVGEVNASNHTISFGTPVVFNAATTGDNIDLTFDSNSNKVVIAYRDEGDSDHGKAIVGTVDPSDNSISFGTEATFESAATSYIGVTFDNNLNKVVIAYQDAANSLYGTAIVGTVSGTSISFGSPVVFESARTEFVSIAFDSNVNKVVIAYKDYPNGQAGTAIVGTVSGTSISFGLATTFVTRTGSNTIVYDPSQQKVVVFYRDDTTFPSNLYGKARVGTISGTSISFGTAVTIETGTFGSDSATYDSALGKVLFSYQGPDNHGQVVSGTISSTDITFESSVEFSSASTVSVTSIIFDTNASKAVIAYKDSGDSNKGKALVYQPINITRGQVADGGNASVDIIGSVSDNQVISLTAGQQYFVQPDGTIGTTADSPSVLAGTAISATELVVKT